MQIAFGLAAAHEKDRPPRPEAGKYFPHERRAHQDPGIGAWPSSRRKRAPELVRGEAADPRTDIFAFGAVLYEMLSGLRAFCRNTPAESMAAVLKEDPRELSDPCHPVSPALDRIVRRCLEKNPDRAMSAIRS